nr:MAG TPA: hypothetical protein [Caudoviricetes sp.]
MYRENGIYLTIVGEREAIDKLEEVRQVALSEAGIGKEQFKKWQEDYVEGFFDGLIGNLDLGWFGSVSNNPHVLGILDGADSTWRYVKDKENR